MFGFIFLIRNYFILFYFNEKINVINDLFILVIISITDVVVLFFSLSNKSIMFCSQCGGVVHDF